MARNSYFHSPAREPLKADPRLELVPQHTTGVFSFLNPTRAQLTPTVKSTTPTAACSSSQSQTPRSEAIPASSAAPEAAATTTTAPVATSEHVTTSQSSPSISYLWRSRDNRKGRHALLITKPQAPTKTSSAPSSSPPPPPTTAQAGPMLISPPPRTSRPHAILHILTLMATRYPYWDISWLVAVLFTLGSVIWVINAFFVWLPLADPQTAFPGEISAGGGWTAFVGATVFEVGSVLLMLEAVNENRASCFGWALQRVVRDVQDGVGLTVWAVEPLPACKHHHTNRRNFVGRGAEPAEAAAAAAIAGGNGTDSDASSVASKSPSTSTPAPAEAIKSWQWFPSTSDLTTHYLRELGFLACLFQLLGASIFWISGFTALPQIQALLPTQAALDGAYWAPQIVGGSGFIVSSTLFMLETQSRWYVPAYGVLGWHIGLWNLVGALGFTLCGALGLAYQSEAAQFQACLATFWGSWAFLIGSAVQWYECLDTHPVEVRVVKATATTVVDGEKMV